MSKNEIASKDKVMMPIRLEPDLYQKMMEEVHKRKRSARGYSANRFITELIEEAISKKGGRE